MTGSFLGWAKTYMVKLAIKTFLGFFAEPFRFETRFKRIATWDNLSMGQSIDGKFYIWGEYGPVFFPCITIKRKMNQTCQIDREVQVDMDEINPDKKSIDGKSEPPPSYSEIDLPSCSNQNPSTDDNQAMNTNQDIQKVDGTNSEKDKNQEKSESEAMKNAEIERRELEEAIKNSEVEILSLHLNLFKMREVNCHSLEEIVARKFDVSYFTLTNSDNPVDTEDYNDKDLIDLSDFMVVRYIQYYEEKVVSKEPGSTEKDDKQKMLEKDVKETRKRLEELEKTKSSPQVFNYIKHMGEKANYSVISKSNLSEIKDLNVSDLVQTGTKL